MRLLSGVISLCLATSVHAADESANIFNADLSNTDLELAVEAFEQVCMPFVLHKTELTRELDKAHYRNQIETQGFVFQSQENTGKNYSLGPRNEPTKIASEAGWKANKNKNCKFTIHNGVSSQVVNSCETIVSQTGEIGGYATPNIATYKVDSVIETYSLQNDERLTLLLGWNYRSQKYPGKSCETKLKQSAITKAEFGKSFIDKDADWQVQDDGLSQCVKDGENSFRFSVKHNPDTLSLHLVRNDLFAPSVCGR